MRPGNASKKRLTSSTLNCKKRTGANSSRAMAVRSPKSSLVRCLRAKRRGIRAVRRQRTARIPLLFLLRHYRQGEAKCGTSALLAFHPHATGMAFDNFAGDVEA